MSYTDLRDFDAEYATTRRGHRIEIEKLGGGTVGNSYEGSWRYIVRTGSLPSDDVLTQGQGLHTGTPKTHAEAALILADFLEGES